MQFQQTKAVTPQFQQFISNGRVAKVENALARGANGETLIGANPITITSFNPILYS